MIIDGGTFTWTRKSPTGNVPPSIDVVYVLWCPDDRSPVEIGRLYRMGHLWEVIPRLGGWRRAQAAGMGYVSIRNVGIRHLVELARTESDLTMDDKIQFRIIRDGTDTSQEVVPLILR